VGLPTRLICNLRADSWRMWATISTVAGWNRDERAGSRRGHCAKTDEAALPAIAAVTDVEGSL